MRRYLLLACLVAALAPVGFMSGCDREVEHEKKTTANPNTGEVQTREKTVKQTPSGTVIEEKRSTDNP